MRRTLASDAHAIHLRGPGFFNDCLYTLIVLASILLEKARRFRICRRVRIRVAQEALNRCQHRRDVVDRAPIVLEKVQTDAPVLHQEKRNHISITITYRLGIGCENARLYMKLEMKE